jgi:hypothetical protein
MAYRPLFNSKKREALWQRESLAAHLAGRGTSPICNICGLPVTPGQAWDESHDGAPKAFGGRSTGIAHRRCNHDHGAQVVAPAAAKAKRVHRKHIGAAGAGLGRYPMAAGRRSDVSKTMHHGLQPRLTGAQKHAAMMAARYPFLSR